MEAKTSFFEDEIRKQKESRRYVISAWVKCNFEDEFSRNYVVEERGFGCSHTGDYSWSHLNSVGLMHFDSVEEAEEWFSAHKKVLCEGPRTVIEPAVSEVVCNVAKDLSFEGQLGSAEDTKPSINAESTLVGKSVDDVMICPKCGSDNCYEYSTDEIEFSYDNTGHYFVDCRCKNCDKGFRLYTRFKYELTDTRT